MAYTNSSLVDYTKISPNKTSPRNHTIDTISIHCVVGQCSVETLGSIFASSSRQASSNYGIGYDGRVGMYVEEKDRSWCTSSSANDNRAITIEVASDTTSPYAVKDVALKALINLLTDICKRNGIKQLLWQGDKSLIGQVAKQNMTVHRWFANKACPGDYLYNKHGYIASEVNARLGDGVLCYGCEGDLVSELQRLLIAAGYSVGYSGVDGDFGSGTESAVIEYQADNNLDADGVVGEKTWASLKGVTVSDSSTSTSTNSGSGTTTAATSYTVKVKNEIPMFSNPPTETLSVGTFTIVEEKNGFGKLKSGKGWIELAKVEKKG